MASMQTPTGLTPSSDLELSYLQLSALQRLTSSLHWATWNSEHILAPSFRALQLAHEQTVTPALVLVSTDRKEKLGS